MTTIKELLDERARAMALHDEDNYGPIYIVGAANAIIADVLNARDDLLTGAPAAGAEVAPAAPVIEEPAPAVEPIAADPAPADEPAVAADPAPVAPVAEPAPVEAPAPAAEPAPKAGGKA